MAEYKPGDIVNGMMFRGGDPSQKKNWGFPGGPTWDTLKPGDYMGQYVFKGGDYNDKNNWASIWDYNPPAPKPEQGFFGDLWSAAKSGGNQLQMAITSLQNELGLITDEDAAKAYARDIADIASLDWSKSALEGREAISNEKGFWATFGELFKNPRAGLTMLAESVVAHSPTILAIAGGTVLGGPAGTAAAMAGTGATSGVVDYANTLIKNMQDAKVDITDPDAILAFMSDPERMAAARKDAALHGVGVAVFDAISAGIAGKILGPVARSKVVAGKAASQAIGMGRQAAAEVIANGGSKAAAKAAFESTSLAALRRTPRIAGLVAELGSQGLLGGAGEMSGQLLSKGEIDEPGAIALEIALEIPFGALEIGTALKGRKLKAGQADLVAEKLRALADAANAIPGRRPAEERDPLLALPAPSTQPAAPLALPAPETIYTDDAAAATDRTITPIDRDIGTQRPDAAALADIQKNLAALRAEEPDFRVSAQGDVFRVVSPTGQAFGDRYQTYEEAQKAAAGINRDIAERRTLLRGAGEVASGPTSVPVESLSPADRKAIVAARRKAKQNLSGSVGRSELEAVLGGRLADQYLSADRPVTQDTGVINRVLGTETPVKVGGKEVTVFENEYDAAAQMIQLTGRADKEAIIEAIGDRGEENTNALFKLLENRGVITSVRPGVYRPSTQMTQERRTVASDLPEGPKNYDIKEVRTDVTTLPIGQWAVPKGKAPEGSTTAWGVVNRDGEVVSAHESRKSAFGAKSKQDTVKRIYANVPQNAWAVVEERRNADGELSGRAAVQTFPSQAEAQAELDRLRGTAEEQPPASRPRVPVVNDATQQRDQWRPGTTEAPAGWEVPVAPKPTETTTREINGRQVELERTPGVAEVAAAFNPPQDARNEEWVLKADEKLIQRNNELYKAIRALLNKYGLRDIGLRISRGISDDYGTLKDNAAGSYNEKLIRLATAVNQRQASATGVSLEQMITDTVNHEVIHAMRELGLFTDAEWKALSDYAAKNGWLARILNSPSYRAEGITGEAAVEEAIAEAFRYWNRGMKRVGPRVNSIFRKLLNFFKDWVSALRGNTAEDIFRAITTGEIGTRQAQARAADFGMSVEAFEEAIRTPTPSALDALVRNHMAKTTAQKARRFAVNPTATPAFRRGGDSYTVDLNGYADDINPSASFALRSIRGDGFGSIRGRLLDNGTFWADHVYFRPNGSEVSRDLTPAEQASVFSAIKSYFPELKVFSYRAIDDEGKLVRRRVTKGAKIDNSSLKSIDSLVKHSLVDFDPIAKRHIETAARGSAIEHAEARRRAIDVAGYSNILPFVTDTELRDIVGNSNAKTVAQRARLLSSVFEHFDQFRFQTVSSALAGRAKRGWYKKAANAIVKIFGVKDGLRFAYLMAALSPQISVEGNLENTVRIWLAWQRANYTTDPEAVERIVRESVHTGAIESMTAANLKKLAAKINADEASGYNIKIDQPVKSLRAELASIPENVRAKHSALDAWVPNAVSALSTEETELLLSGPKVTSFAMNLAAFDLGAADTFGFNPAELALTVHERALAVTLDTWMGTFYGIPQSFFRSMKGTRADGSYRGLITPRYAGVAAAIRRAAQEISEITGEQWTPMEVQETVWSFVHALMTMAESRVENPNKLTPAQVLGADMLTHGRITQVPDIVTLMGGDLIWPLLKGTIYAKQVQDIRETAAYARRGGQGPRPEGSVFRAEGLPVDEDAFQAALQEVAERIADKSVSEPRFSLAPPIGSEEFRSWFGDSKIVDARGNPLVMYHITTHDFDFFNGSRGGVSGVAGFFTPEPKFLDFFADASDMKSVGRRVIPVYISSQNPFDFDNPDHVNAVVRSLRLMEGDDFVSENRVDNIMAGDWDTIEDVRVLDAIRSAGFDSFTVYEGGQKNLGVFDAVNIKSAISNFGTYSREDDRIHYSLDDNISPVPDSEHTDLLTIPDFLRRDENNNYIIPRQAAEPPPVAAEGQEPLPVTEEPESNQAREAAIAAAGEGRLFAGTYTEGQWRTYRAEIRRVGKPNEFVTVNARNVEEARRRIYGPRPRQLADGGFEISAIVDMEHARPFAVKLRGKTGRTVIRHVMARSMNDAARVVNSNKRPGWEVLGIYDEEPGQKFSLYDASDLEKMRPEERLKALKLSGVGRFFSETSWEMFSVGEWSRETIVIMSPDDFMSLAPQQLHSPQNISAYAENLDRGMRLADVPYLKIMTAPDGRPAEVIGHEGRHRMAGFKKLGMIHIPVRIISEPDRELGAGSVRWGIKDPTDRDYVVAPSALKPQMGAANPDFRLDMPDSVIYPRADGISDLLATLEDGESVPQNVIVGVPPDQAALMEIGDRLRRTSYPHSETLRNLPSHYPTAQEINAKMGMGEIFHPLHAAAKAGGAIRDYESSGLGVYGNWDPAWSSGYEAVFPATASDSDMAALAAQAFRKAKEHGQNDAFVARRLSPEEKGPHVRPGLTVYFYQHKLNMDAADIAATIRNMPATEDIGGMTAFTQGNTGRFIGMRFIWTPEYTNTEPTVAAAEKALVSIDELAKYFMSNNIGSTSIDHYDAILGYKENYDELIGRLEAVSGGIGAGGDAVDAGSQLWRRPIREVFEERARAKELSPSTGENPVGSVPTQQEDRLPELVAEPDQISDGQRWSLAEPEEPKKVRSPSAGLLSWGTFSFRGTPYQVQMDENALAHITKRHGSEFSRFNRDIGSVIESITRTMLPGHAARDDVKLFAERFGNRVELVAEAQLPLSSARRGKETVRIILTPTGETAPLRGTDRRATVMTPVTAYVVGAKSERIETINSWRATKYSVADPDLYARARDVMFAREGSSGLIDTIVRKLFGAVEGESWRKAFVRNMVNRFSPAFELDMAAHNNQLPNVAHSVFKSAELAGAIESRVAQIIKVGPVMIDPATGEIRLVPGGRGLEAILGQVGHADLKDFHAYGIARRELEVRAAIRAGRKKGTKESFSSLSDAELQGIIDAAPENFRNAFAELQELNRHMLNFAVDTGLVSREKADEFASMDYLPYYRVLEDETGSGEPTVLGPANRSGLNNPRSALSVRLKGGDGAIGDLVENLVRNMQSILGASMKNYAAQRAGMAIDKLRAMGDNSYGERVASGDGKHIMRYYINGKPVYYRIDDAPFWAMLASMRPVQQNALISVGSSFSSVLRIGVTVTPAFMIKNLVRGKVSAFVTTDAPLDPFVKTFRAFIDVLRGHPDAEEMKAMSGFGGYSYGQQARSAAAKASRNLRRAGDGYGVNALQRWKDRFAAMLDKLEDIGEATELAERLVLYRHLRDRGLSVGDAGYEAANLINFGRRGAGNGYLPAGVVSLIPLIPFLNARIQGIYRIFENQKRQRTVAGIPIGVVLRGMLVTAFSAALWALNSDDKRWDDEPLERKMLNDIFYIGDTSFTVPRAFEVGTIFGALPVVLLDAIKKQDGRDVAKAVSFAFMNTFAFNPIPQMVRPAIEVYTNYDFFRGGSLEPLSLQHLQKSDRQTRFTSGAARGIAGMLGLSPIQFDHLVGGYLGSSGDMMLAVADAFLANVGAIPERPAGLFGNPQGAGVIGTILGGRSFARSEDERPSRAVRDFYEMKEAATEMMGSYKEAVLTGRPERAAEIATKAGFGANTALNRLASQIGDINRLSRMIENDPNMSPEEKRAKLAPLAELRKEIASIGVNLGRGLGL